MFKVYLVQFIMVRSDIITGLILCVSIAGISGFSLFSESGDDGIKVSVKNGKGGLTHLDISSLDSLHDLNTISLKLMGNSGQQNHKTMSGHLHERLRNIFKPVKPASTKIIRKTVVKSSIIPTSIDKMRRLTNAGGYRKSFVNYTPRTRIRTRTRTTSKSKVNLQRNTNRFLQTSRISRPPASGPTPYKRQLQVTDKTNNKVYFPKIYYENRNKNLPIRPNSDSPSNFPKIIYSGIKATQSKKDSLIATNGKNVQLQPTGKEPTQETSQQPSQKIRSQLPKEVPSITRQHTTINTINNVNKVTQEWIRITVNNMYLLQRPNIEIVKVGNDIFVREKNSRLKTTNSKHKFLTTNTEDKTINNVAKDNISFVSTNSNIEKLAPNYVTDSNKVATNTKTPIHTVKNKVNTNHSDVNIKTNVIPSKNDNIDTANNSALPNWNNNIITTNNNMVKNKSNVVTNTNYVLTPTNNAVTSGDKNFVHNRNVAQIKSVVTTKAKVFTDTNSVSVKNNKNEVITNKGNKNIATTNNNVAADKRNNVDTTNTNDVGLANNYNVKSKKNNVKTKNSTTATTTNKSNTINNVDRAKDSNNHIFSTKDNHEATSFNYFVNNIENNVINNKHVTTVNNHLTTADNYAKTANTNVIKNKNISVLRTNLNDINTSDSLVKTNIADKQNVNSTSPDLNKTSNISSNLFKTFFIRTPTGEIIKVKTKLRTTDSINPHAKTSSPSKNTVIYSTANKKPTNLTESQSAISNNNISSSSYAPKMIIQKSEYSGNISNTVTSTAKKQERTNTVADQLNTTDSTVQLDSSQNTKNPLFTQQNIKNNIQNNIIPLTSSPTNMVPSQMQEMSTQKHIVVDKTDSTKTLKPKDPPVNDLSHNIQPNFPTSTVTNLRSPTNSSVFKELVTDHKSVPTIPNAVLTKTTVEPTPAINDTATPMTEIKQINSPVFHNEIENNSLHIPTSNKPLSPVLSVEPITSVTSIPPIKPTRNNSPVLPIKSEANNRTQVIPNNSPTKLKPSAPLSKPVTTNNYPVLSNKQVTTNNSQALPVITNTTDKFPVQPSKSVTINNAPVMHNKLTTNTDPLVLHGESRTTSKFEGIPIRSVTTKNSSVLPGESTKTNESQVSSTTAVTTKTFHIPHLNTTNISAVLPVETTTANNSPVLPIKPTTANYSSVVPIKPATIITSPVLNTAFARANNSTMLPVKSTTANGPSIKSTTFNNPTALPVKPVTPNISSVPVVKPVTTYTSEVLPLKPATTNDSAVKPVVTNNSSPPAKPIITNSFPLTIVKQDKSNNVSIMNASPVTTSNSPVISIKPDTTSISPVSTIKSNIINNSSASITPANAENTNSIHIPQVEPVIISKSPLAHQSPKINNSSPVSVKPVTDNFSVLAFKADNSKNSLATTVKPDTTKNASFISTKQAIANKTLVSTVKPDQNNNSSISIKPAATNNSPVQPFIPVTIKSSIPVGPTPLDSSPALLVKQFTNNKTAPSPVRPTKSSNNQSAYINSQLMPFKSKYQASNINAPSITIKSSTSNNAHVTSATDINSPVMYVNPAITTTDKPSNIISPHLVKLIEKTNSSDLATRPVAKINPPTLPVNLSENTKTTTNNQTRNESFEQNSFTKTSNNSQSISKSPMLTVPIEPNQTPSNISETVIPSFSTIRNTNSVNTSSINNFSTKAENGTSTLAHIFSVGRGRAFNPAPLRVTASQSSVTNSQVTTNHRNDSALFLQQKNATEVPLIIASHKVERNNVNVSNENTYKHVDVLAHTLLRASTNTKEINSNIFDSLLQQSHQLDYILKHTRNVPVWHTYTFSNGSVITWVTIEANSSTNTHAVEKSSINTTTVVRNGENSNVIEPPVYHHPATAQPVAKAVGKVPTSAKGGEQTIFNETGVLIDPEIENLDTTIENNVTNETSVTDQDSTKEKAAIKDSQPTKDETIPSEVGVAVEPEVGIVSNQTPLVGVQTEFDKAVKIGSDVLKPKINTLAPSTKFSDNKSAPSQINKDKTNKIILTNPIQPNKKHKKSYTSAEIIDGGILVKPFGKITISPQQNVNSTSPLNTVITKADLPNITFSPSAKTEIKMNTDSSPVTVPHKSKLIFTKKATPVDKTGRHTETVISLKEPPMKIKLGMAADVAKKQTNSTSSFQSKDLEALRYILTKNGIESAQQLEDLLKQKNRVENQEKINSIASHFTSMENKCPENKPCLWCRSSPAWSHVDGMSGWCMRNCKTQRCVHSRCKCKCVNASEFSSLLETIASSDLRGK